jgi:hypothetical protein
MNRCLLLIIMTLGLVSCQEKDTQYYRHHIKELHAQALHCDSKGSINCDVLDALSRHMNQLGQTLQISPQAFGNKILGLQQTIAMQKRTTTQDRSNQPSIEDNQRQLTDLLSVVKWLESPEG